MIATKTYYNLYDHIVGFAKSLTNQQENKLLFINPIVLITNSNFTIRLLIGVRLPGRLMGLFIYCFLRVSHTEKTSEMHTCLYNIVRQVFCTENKSQVVDRK